MGIFTNNKGIRCEPTQDGRGLNCRLFEADGNEKLSTGTEVTITADSNDNCEPRIVGTMDMMEKDKKRVAQIAELVRKSCRKGIG